MDSSDLSASSSYNTLPIGAPIAPHQSMGLNFNEEGTELFIIKIILFLNNF